MHTWFPSFYLSLKSPMIPPWIGSWGRMWPRRTPVGQVAVNTWPHDIQRWYEFMMYRPTKTLWWFNITVENHHFLWENPVCMAIFNRYWLARWHDHRVVSMVPSELGSPWREDHRCWGNCQSEGQICWGCIMWLIYSLWSALTLRPSLF